MGTISAGIGLVSGIDTATLIEQLLALESRPRIVMEQRIVGLKSQQTAMLDINARLLNLKNAVKAFRADKIFASALASSSNESVLTATASAGALPGSYNFTVDRLVNTSQQMSRGFADASSAAIGLTRLSFELGQGKVQRDQPLSELNGGNGVRRGKIVIQDASGASSTIDLSRTVTVQEVIDAINADGAISVTATVNGDALELADTSGGAGSMTVSNATGYFTATDLGILGNDGGTGTLTGSAINTIGGDTSLSQLNDGNGVRIHSGLGNPDFIITDRSGAAHQIILGSYDNGATIESAVTTVQGVIDRITAISGGAVTGAIAADGVSLELTDNTGGAGNFSVTGTGSNGDQTAADLGILNAGVAGNTISGGRLVATMNSVMLRSLNGGSGILGFATGAGGLKSDTPLADLFDGSGLATNGTTAADIRFQDRTGASFDIDLDAMNSVQDLIDAVENASDGNITGSIQSGNVLRFTNEVAGASNFTISDINGSTAAADMGIVIDSPPLSAQFVDSIDLDPAGPGGATLSITNRNGVVTAIDLSAAFSLSDVIDTINNAGAGITASFNQASNGLLITDDTGGSGNLIIAGDAADDLGLNTGAAGIAAAAHAGENLQLQYVSGATGLDALNYGRGIGTGKFRIFDADGASAEVDIGSDAKTLQDIIDEINSKGLAINARINDNGDGLLIESTSVAGTLAMRVDSISGSTARDLGILGEAADPLNANFIDGSYEREITFSASDTLNDIAGKINGANVPVAASIVNTGAGSKPFHLTLSSEISGSIGDMSIDTNGFDLGLQTLSRGENGRVFFGAADPARAVLIETTDNTLDDVIADVNIDLVAASSSPVTVSIVRDNQAVIDGVNEFITTFNDVIGRLNQYDKYDAETEQRGVLLGDPTVLRVRSMLYRTLQGAATGVDGQFSHLTQVGIRIGSEGELTFNEERFRAALETDPEAVAELFAAFEQESNENNGEVTPGVTTGSSSTVTHTRLGVMEQFTLLLDRLTDTIDGTLKVADNGFQSQIDLLEDSIERFNAKLEAKRVQLERQFTAMESALARLQGQQGSLASLQAAVLTATTAGIGGLR